jgi:hypothetical protein
MSNYAEARIFPFHQERTLTGIKVNSAAQLLLDYPGRFVMSHTPDLVFSQKAYMLARFKGGRNFVWFGVQQGVPEIPEEDRLPGLFNLDRRNNRVLYDPTAEIPGRESLADMTYNHFGFNKGIKKILEELATARIPFFQISSVKQSLLHQTQINPFEAAMLNIEIDKIYRDQTERVMIPEPFIISGQTSVEAIVHGNFLPVPSLDLNQPRKLIDTLKENWG